MSIVSCSQQPYQVHVINISIIHIFHDLKLNEVNVTCPKLQVMEPQFTTRIGMPDDGSRMLSSHALHSRVLTLLSACLILSRPFSAA